jgi:hypothetical protein
MQTPDGWWTVEAINLDGHACFRVKQNGFVAQGSRYPRTIAEVAKLLGPAFPTLQEA